VHAEDEDEPPAAMKLSRLQLIALSLGRSCQFGYLYFLFVEWDAPWDAHSCAAMIRFIRNPGGIFFFPEQVNT
jgi:hypothetical protein